MKINVLKTKVMRIINSKKMTTISEKKIQVEKFRHLKSISSQSGDAKWKLKQELLWSKDHMAKEMLCHFKRLRLLKFGYGREQTKTEHFFVCSNIIKQKKGIWMGYIMRRNVILMNVLEGTVEEGKKRGKSCQWWMMLRQEDIKK